MCSPLNHTARKHSYLDRNYTSLRVLCPEWTIAANKLMIKVVYDMHCGAYRKPQSAMVKFLSGDALVTQEFPNQIGVVIFAPDASSYSNYCAAFDHTLADSQTGFFLWRSPVLLETVTLV